MSLWFTTRLETIELDAEDDACCSSPFRMARAGEAKIYYRLTPDTSAWIAGMMQRAEKKHGLPAAFLLDLVERHKQIQDYASKNFPASEIEAAAKRGGSLPVEPTFG